MKYLISLLFFFTISKTVFGQKIQLIHQGIESDSSFYHIAKISDNEFWIGGEYGILKRIDSTGNLTKIDFPNEGLDILKIERVQDYVFIITSDAIIYRYNLKKESFLKKEFPKFKNKCFYDMIALANGDLLVCGGASGIAKAKRKMPKGFIATIDQDLNEINVVWKNKRKFVWSLLQTEDQNVLAATFNGISTKILGSKDLKSWNKKVKIKGLIHEITDIKNEVWYCGSKNIRFRKHGIIGQAHKGESRNIIKDTGCLWSLKSVGGKIIAATQSGELLILENKDSDTERITIPKATTLYEIEKISNTKILVVGHGKSIFIVDFEK